jgi:fibronectin type 3 domain-containing protein
MCSRLIAAFLAVLLLTGCGVSNRSDSTETTQHRVTLTWDPSPSVVLGYHVYRGQGSGGPYLRIATLLPLTTHSDSAVISGQSYYYVVTAVGLDSRESGYSNEAVATIP